MAVRFHAVAESAKRGGLHYASKLCELFDGARPFTLPARAQTGLAAQRPTLSDARQHQWPSSLTHIYAYSLEISIVMAVKYFRTVSPRKACPLIGRHVLQCVSVRRVTVVMFGDYPALAFVSAQQPALT